MLQLILFYVAHAFLPATIYSYSTTNTLCCCHVPSSLGHHHSHSTTNPFTVDFTSDGTPVAIAVGNLWFVCSIGYNINVANHTNHKFLTATPTGVPSEVKSTVHSVLLRITCFPPWATTTATLLLVPLHFVLLSHAFLPGPPPQPLYNLSLYTLCSYHMLSSLGHHHSHSTTNPFTLCAVITSLYAQCHMVDSCRVA